MQGLSHHWPLMWAVDAGCSAPISGMERHSETTQHTVHCVLALCRYSATIGAEGSSKKQHITNLLQQIFPDGITPLADKVARLERREAVWNARLGRFTGTVSCWSWLEYMSGLLLPSRAGHLAASLVHTANQVVPQVAGLHSNKNCICAGQGLPGHSG